MKHLLLVSCVLAIASAAWSPYAYAPWGHHIPVIGHNGVPLDTPEVQAAKAHHFQAHAQAQSRAGYVHGLPILSHNALPLDTPEVAAAKQQHYHDYAVAAQRNGVHVPILGHVSVHPIDTPEVQLAKAAHFAAHAEARSRTGYHHYRKRRALYPQHIPVIGPNGVPVETPEVQHARAQHLAALNAAGTGHSYIPAAPLTYGSPWSHTYPTLAADGQPIETPEVQAAKAHHYQAHIEAQSRIGHAPVGYAHSPAYHGPQYHGPLAHIQIGPGGVPIDTPEVQHARAAHLAAHYH